VNPHRLMAAKKKKKEKIIEANRPGYLETDPETNERITP